MRAIILSAGLGTKLRPLTFLQPKALFPLANRPNIYFIVDLLKSHGLKELIINLHYLPDQLTKSLGDGSNWKIKINYSNEKVIQGTAGCLRQAKDYLKEEDFLIINGDIATNIDLSSLIAFHRRKDSLFTLALTRRPPVSTCSFLSIDGEGKVVSLPPQLPLSGAQPGIYTGIAVASSDVLRYIPQSYFPLLGLLRKLMQAGEPIYGQITSRYWLDMGTFSCYQRAHWDVLDGHLELDLPGQSVQERVWVGSETEVSPTVELRPPVLLGRGCQIKSGARVGPFAVVGDDCLIGRGAKLEWTILWESVNLSEFCCLRDCIVPAGLSVAAGSFLDKSVLYR